MLRRLLYAVVAVGVFACSPADVSAPAPDQPDVADTRSTPPRDVFGFNDSAGMWAEPEPDAGWFNPMGRGGGWGMLPRLGGAHCGPAGQWSGHIPNPKHPTVPGVVVTATADCPSDPFPSDDVVMDWLRRVNAQRREWASGGWSPFAPGASPTAEEAQYCRARIGQAPSPEEFAETVEWAELACPPCFEALVLAFGAWESWQTAGAIVEVGQRLLREGMPCGREAVIMALGALSTITRGVTGPVGNAVWNRIAPNGALIGTRFGRTDKNRDLAGGLAAAEALFCRDRSSDGRHQGAAGICPWRLVSGLARWDDSELPPFFQFRPCRDRLQYSGKACGKVQVPRAIGLVHDIPRGRPST